MCRQKILLVNVWKCYRCSDCTASQQLIFYCFSPRDSSLAKPQELCNRFGLGSPWPDLGCEVHLYFSIGMGISDHFGRHSRLSSLQSG